ncbi:hypothetical protein BJX64DRAFT_263811 [Aspergillus heterothallicus]
MPLRRTWSQSEDDKLISLVARFGGKTGRESRWHEISKNLSDRTNKVRFHPSCNLQKADFPCTR